MQPISHSTDMYFMAALCNQPPLHKTAQDDMGGLFSSIQSAVMPNYDPNDKISSILGFIGPGLLRMLGFGWIPIIMTVAEAFGFNWTQFYHSIRTRLEPLLKEITEGTGSSDDIHAAVEESAQEASSGQPNLDKVMEAAKMVVNSASPADMLVIRKLAIEYHHKLAQDNTPATYKFISRFLSSGRGTRLRGGITGLIVRLVAWVISAIVISAGFHLAGSMGSSIMGIKRQPTASSTSDTAPQATLELNPNADHSLMTTTYNDTTHIWMLNFNVNKIDEQLIDWTQELYPELNDLDAFKQSAKFNDIVNQFRERNQAAMQLELTAVPTPFTSIKQIIDVFAHDVKSHTKTQATNT